MTETDGRYMLAIEGRSVKSQRILTRNEGPNPENPGREAERSLYYFSSPPKRLFYGHCATARVHYLYEIYAI